MDAKHTTFSVANIAPSPAKRRASRRVSEQLGLQNATNSPALDTSHKHKGERVKVYVRVRPTKSGCETPGQLHLHPDGCTLSTLREEHYASDFAFDQVLGPSATQADVYAAAAAPIVSDVLRGYNATLLAYGQTGAGKTHTLSSMQPDAVGIIPRAASEIFAAVGADPMHDYVIHMSYLQIYCEQMQDLLSPETGDNLPIREGEGGAVHVPGLRQVEVKNLDDCLRLLQLGDRNRTVAFTALNAHSSRSHAVVMLTVVKRQRMDVGSCDDGAQGKDLRRGAGRVHVGKLFMVDLAGSERLKKSKSTGQRAHEAKAINLSLTTLGMCVSARASGAGAHVPFRDSKLTRLLQESLGGNARTSLVVAVCDAKEHSEETLQSLQFGARAMRVTTHARVNERAECSLPTQDEVSLAAALRGSRTSLLEQTLLEKEGQLEAVQAQLKAEQERSRQVVESLEREGRQAREAALALAARHEEQLREEHAHRMTLHERVQAAELLAAEAERRRVEDVQALEAQVHAANKGAAAAQRQLEEERSAWQRKLLEERTAMQCQLEEERSAWRRQWDTDRAVLVECHEAETLELIRVWEERVKEAESVTAAQAARHAEEVGDVRGQWAAELKAAQQLHKEEIETIRVDAAEQVATAHAACAALTAEFEASKCQAEAMCSAAAARLRRVEDEWEQRLAEVTASLGVREAEASELRGAVRRRELKLAQARGAAKQLEDKLAEAEGVIGKMHKNIAHMNKRLQECESSVLDAEDRIAQLAASRFALAAFLLEQRRLDRAARVIQRAFRAHRLRVVQRQRVEGYAALHEAQSALGTLAAQHAELEERRHANLAFAGQTLVAESLGVLQDAVEGLMATFLLPAKDLKAVQRFRNKRAVGAAVTGPGPLVPPLGSAAEEWFEDKQVQIMSNSRCEGGELIRAFTP